MNWKLKSVLTITALLLGTSALAQSKTTLNVLVISGLEEYTQKVADQYMKEKPGLDIKLEVLPFDALFQQTQVRLSGGATSPDALFVDGPVVASYGAQNFLAPLDAYFNAREINEFLPAVRGTSFYGGKLLATPVCSSSMMVYYNKDILKKQDIAFPSNDPKKRLTWEEFAKLAQKATVKEGNRVTSWGFTMQQPVAPYQVLPFVQSLGGKAIGDDGLTVKGVINSPEWVKGLKFYQSLYNELGVSPKGNVDGWQLFESGKAAFFQGVTYFGSNPLPAQKAFAWGVMPNPYFAGGKAVTTTDCWHVGVNRRSNNIAQAADFVKYLTNGKGQDLFWQLGQLDPVLKRNANKVRYNVKYKDTAQKLAAIEGGTTAISRPVTPGFNEYQDILTQAFGNIRNGQDPKEALDAAADQIDRTFAKYRK